MIRRTLGPGIAGIFLIAPWLLSPPPAAAAPVNGMEACLRESGDTAIAACTRAIASGRHKGADLAQLHYNRGVEYSGKGDIERAIVDYSAAIRLDPRFVPPLINRGMSYVEKENYDRGIADYNEALRLDRNQPLIFINRGSAYLAKGDYDRAIADYNEAIRLDPKDVSAFVGRGDAYQLKGDTERAIAEYGEALRIEPKPHATELDLHKRRGQAYSYIGNYHAAAADLANVVLGSPRDAEAVLWLLAARARAGTQSAMEMQVHAEAIKSTDWPYPLVELFLGRRTPAAALAAAGTAEERCQAQFWIGAWHVTRGERAAARAPLQAAADTCPKKFPEYHGARGELQRLAQ
jgi:tetratricopeptide (TPR) repeat protein